MPINRLTFAVSCAANYETPIAASHEYTPDNITLLYETIPALTADFFIDKSFGFALLQGLLITPIGGDLTLDFINGTHSIVEVPIADGFPWVWMLGSGTNPFDEDIDGIYVTNAGADGVILEGRVGWNNPGV